MYEMWQHETYEIHIKCLPETWGKGVVWET